MPMSQMNIRIDGATRAEGNLALRSIGLTPAKTVRAVWGFAAKNRNNPEKLRRVFKAFDDHQEAASEFEGKKALAEQGWRIVPDGLAEAGLPSPEPDATPYDELKERAYREYWEARGVL